jgi:hypothetical protein
VRLRADFNPDETPGVGPYLSWRLDRIDDGSLVAVHLGGRALALIDDPFGAQLVEGVCVPDCEAGVEPVALRLSEGDEELTLTAPGIGTIAGYQVWLGDAELNLCAPGVGQFNVMIALDQ